MVGNGLIPMPQVVYSRHYNMGFLGLERLHPFDARKYGRAWRVLRRRLGRALDRVWLRPNRPASTEELMTVHSLDYLKSLGQADRVARALELPQIAWLPAAVIELAVLKPMRWATRGTIVAAEAAIQKGLAINLGGGFHHAKPAAGEGFCIYNDVAIAIDCLRRGGLLGPRTRVAYVDLDAHQGNGVCHVFRNDSRVFIFDMYNREIYPAGDEWGSRRIDCDVPLPSGCKDNAYLDRLAERLPGFLDSVSQSQTVGLAIYNAGSDIVAGDPLGALGVSANGVLRRDLYVVRQLRQRKLPTLVVLGGGYTRVSYQLVANSVERWIQQEPGSIT
jgi:histone deacetylase 11